ncbi:MAG: hypothetical protein HYZ16_11010 [Bacteroidetes bacterium]|nr:hypothetical protein [Bacteroidota bacterium]
MALSKAVSGTDIWVAAGTYYPGSSASEVFNLKDGVNLLGGFMGNETAAQARNPLTNITILSGNIGDPKVATDNSSLILKANKLTT